ncbi:MAG: response regulator [Thermodesulfobacteriota bacterium]
MTNSDRDQSIMGEAEVKLPILIAEDDPTLGEALTGFLREKGHAVNLARTGGEALALLEKQSYPLVITDLVMPEADGLMVLRAARQRDPATLVVIMTGYASIDSAIEATREGAYDYLRKPFKLQEIEIAVSRAARLLFLDQENQRLLHKLSDLTAQLEDLQQTTRSPQEDAPPSGKARQPRYAVPFPLSNYFLLGQDQEPENRSELEHLQERLKNLYKEKLLTEKEYQVLKQRILI